MLKNVSCCLTHCSSQVKTKNKHQRANKENHKKKSHTQMEKKRDIKKQQETIHLFQ